MPVTGIEAMFDAMMHTEGWAPGSISNRNRNPLNLRDSPIPHTTDARDYCVFPALLHGVLAGMTELHMKVTGNNKHGIGPDSTLEQLYDVYAPRSDHNNPNSYAVAVAQWCSTALGRTLTPQSKLREVCTELFTEVK